MAGVTAPPVCVIGSGSQLSNWTTGVPMTLVGTDLYEACVTYLAGTPIQNVEYKFKKDDCATWESVDNHTLTIDNGSPATQTITSTWDNGPASCSPVFTHPGTWGQLKAIYR
jgi:hypothetical protein